MVRFACPIYCQLKITMTIKDFFSGYNLTYRETDGPWLEAWPVTKETRLLGTQQHTIAGLKCGTKYSVRVTATDNIGTSAPAHVDVITLGSGKFIYY